MIRHVNDFYVPESDFFDYREKAIEMRQLHWPAESKRPPLYSALVALLSAPLPGKHRELYAAEVIGVISALAGLWLVFQISRHLLGQYAFIVAWLWALHPTTLRMAIKPKPEILVMVLILWAFERFLRGDKRAYLLAFIATLVRYEGALAIMAFAAAEFLFEKRKLLTIGRAALAGSFILVWTLVHSGGSGGASYGNYYNDYQPGFAFIGNFWGGIIGFLPLQWYKLWAAGGAALLLAGVVCGFQQFRREITAVVIFLLGFLAMHVVWPFSNVDYVVIASWSTFLLMVLGAQGFYKIIQRYLHALWSRVMRELDKRVAIVGSFVILLVVIVALWRVRFPYPQYEVKWMTVLSFVIPLTWFLWWMSRSLSFSRWSIMGLSMSFFLLLAFYLNSKSVADFFDLHYSKAEFRLVGEWYAAHHRPGDKMVVDQPTVVAYFADLDPAKDFVQLTSVPAVEPERVIEWLRAQQITYIAWLSTNRVYEKEDAWYAWKRDNRGWKTVAFLEQGKDIVGLKMIEQVRSGPRWGYIYQVVSNL